MLHDRRGKTPLLLTDPTPRRLINGVIMFARRVHVVSYPKSGRTWLRVMLHDLGADPRFTHADSRRRAQCGPSDICAGLSSFHGRRIVFLIRDPLDVVVSSYYQALRKGTWDGSLRDFIRVASRGFERILAFNLGWIEHRRHFRDFLLVSYEAMRKDSVRCLREILNFAGAFGASDSDIERVSARNEFNRMKRLERSGELRSRFGSRFTAGAAPDNLMVVRRGLIGGYREEMTEAELEYCGGIMSHYQYLERIRASTVESYLWSLPAPI